MSPLDSEGVREVEARISSMGLPGLRVPKHEPTSLADLDVEKLPNDALGKHYAEHIAYAVYIKGKVAQAKVVLAEAKSTLAMVTARLKREAREAEVPESRIMDGVHEHDDYLAASSGVDVAAAVHDMLEVYMSSHRTQAAALSRIISLRGIDLDGTRNSPGSARSRGLRGPAARRQRGVVEPEDDPVDDID